MDNNILERVNIVSHETSIWDQVNSISAELKKKIKYWQEHVKLKAREEIVCYLDYLSIDSHRAKTKYIIAKAYRVGGDGIN